MFIGTMRLDMDQPERLHEVLLPDSSQKIGTSGVRRQLALDEQDCSAGEGHSTLPSVDRARGDPALVNLNFFPIRKLGIDGFALLPLDVDDVRDLDVI